MDTFLKIEELSNPNTMAMPKLHSHPYYEIYFLCEGKRSFFFNDTLQNLEAPALLVVPPYIMHKTEGGAFRRVNVYVTPNCLNEYQQDLLSSLSLSVLKLTDDKASELIRVLRKDSALTPSDEHYFSVLDAKFSYFMLLLSDLERELAPKELKTEPGAVPLVMSAVNYLNRNYAEEISLDDLCRAVFTAKQTLIYQFKKYLDCSPMKYLLKLRLTKAKELLVTSDESIEKIAELTGFSSGNYLTLIFKQKEGKSPSQYRKETKDFFLR